MRVKKPSPARSGNLGKLLLAQGLLFFGLAVPKAVGGSVGERTAALRSSDPVAVFEASGIAQSYVEQEQN